MYEAQKYKKKWLLFRNAVIGVLLVALVVVNLMVAFKVPEKVRWLRVYSTKQMESMILQGGNEDKFYVYPALSSDLPGWDMSDTYAPAQHLLYADIDRASGLLEVGIERYWIHVIHITESGQRQLYFISAKDEASYTDVELVSEGLVEHRWTYEDCPDVYCTAQRREKVEASLAGMRPYLEPVVTHACLQTWHTWLPANRFPTLRDKSQNERGDERGRFPAIDRLVTEIEPRLDSWLFNIFLTKTRATGDANDSVSWKMSGSSPDTCLLSYD